MFVFVRYGRLLDNMFLLRVCSTPQVPSQLKPAHITMPTPPSAQPLKVPATPSKSGEADKDRTPVATKQQTVSKTGTIAPNDISSPHELTAFVNLLTQNFYCNF